VSAEYSLIGFNEGSGLAPAVDHPDANGNLIGGVTVDTIIINPKLSLTGAPVPLAGSPVINAGKPSVHVGLGGLSEFDARRAPFARVTGGRIDMGAYEFQPSAGAFNGDFNGDQRIDGADFLRWQRGVGSTAGGQASGDATGNGVVDGSDLAVWRSRLPPRVEVDAAAEIIPAMAALAISPISDSRESAMADALFAELELSQSVVSLGSKQKGGYRPAVNEQRFGMTSPQADSAIAAEHVEQNQDFDSLDVAFDGI
jgi:hypothetical protein